MKNIMYVLLALLVITSCTQENLNFELEQVQINQKENVVLKKSNNQVSICHNDGNQLMVAAASLDAHLAHGDAVDMDGDGFYNIANGCSPVDCDDTTYSEDNTCGLVWRTTTTDAQYLYSTDNFETLSASISAHPSWGIQGYCVENATLLSKTTTTSYGTSVRYVYNAGSGFGQITLVLSRDPSISNAKTPIRIIFKTSDYPAHIENGGDVAYFINAPLEDYACIPEGIGTPWE